MVKFFFPAFFALTSLIWGSSPHFLWQVSDSNSSVWVLGSIHMAPKGMYPLDSLIEKAFANSRELAVELNINDDSTLAHTQEAFVRNGMYTNSDLVTNHLSKPMLKRLDSLFNVWDMPSRGFLTLKPWFLAVQIGLLAAEREGLESEQGIDEHFLQEAETWKKSITALETVAQQMGIFEALPDSLQEPLLEWTLSELEDAGGLVDSMFLAWKAGDTLMMEHIALDDQDDPRFQAFFERLYTDRNQTMANRIAEFLRQDRKVFVVVGSAHLVGEGSVLCLLRQQGFRVEQK